MSYDLVIRNGLVVDGTGGEPFPSDVAVAGGRIVAIGTVQQSGADEVDASGCLVTPGFVDVHTHYDGQAIWSRHLAPSSSHGVTTVVMGNCGVGFAPCRPADHALLVNAMEGVEDIPELVMTRGLAWDWETFPEYLAALERRPRDIDVAAFVPHSPLRVYAMGERGANRAPATATDIARMQALAAEAMEAGALGFATSRTAVHYRGDGGRLPSFEAAEAELTGIAGAVGSGGIVQVVTNVARCDGPEARRAEIGVLGRISRSHGVPVTFSLTQRNANPAAFADILAIVDEENGRGAALRPQFAPRCIGLHIGLDLSANPFSACPSYRAIEHLPLDERVQVMRRPEVRAAIVAEPPTERVAQLVGVSRQLDRTFPVGDPPDYEPPRSHSVTALAAARGVDALELAYDLLLEDDGRSMLYVTLANYGNYDLAHLAPMFNRPDAVLGLGDGGAHYGIVCDATQTTFVLTHWARDRPSGAIPVSDAVRALSAVPAELVGLHDRGVLAVGRRADLNVIDHGRLRLDPPEVVHDLPAAGRRIHQRAHGYRCTAVAGTVIVRDDEYTGALPGTLVRGCR